jgi:hypothetical protein
MGAVAIGQFGELALAIRLHGCVGRIRHRLRRDMDRHERQDAGRARRPSGSSNHARAGNVQGPTAPGTALTGSIASAAWTLLP